MPSRPRKSALASSSCEDSTQCGVPRSSSAWTSRRLNASTDRFAISTLSCDIGYSRQPHGFEGCCVVEVPLLPNDLALSEAVDARGIEVGLDAAGPAANVPVVARDHFVVNLKQLPENNLVVALPRLPQPFKPAPDGRASVERPRLHPRRVRYEFGVVVKLVNQGVEVSAVPGVKAPAHHVKVILGHRSRSIRHCHRACGLGAGVRPP